MALFDEPGKWGNTPAFALPMDYNPAVMEMGQGGTNLSASAGIAGLANMQGMAPQGGGMSFFGNPALGQQGWGGTAIGIGSALMNGYLGFKQLGIAKDTLANNKRQFDLNFGAQQKMTNSRLQDRQASRVAANAGAYQDVGSYMKQYGI